MNLNIFFVSRGGIVGRAVLYMALASLPVAISAYSSDKPVNVVLLALTMTYQAGLALRAFIDKSPAQSVDANGDAPLLKSLVDGFATQVATRAANSAVEGLAARLKPRVANGTTNAVTSTDGNEPLKQEET